MNSRPDDLALLLGIVDASQLGQDLSAASTHDQVHLEGTTKERFDLYGFTCPQKTVVDERCRSAGRPPHGGPVTPPTDESTPPDRPQITRPLAPCCLTMATASSTKLAMVQLGWHLQMRNRKLPRISIPPRRVRHLGVKLDAPELATDRFDSGKRAIRAGADAMKTVGQRFDAIAVAHPHGQVFAGGKAGKQLRRRFQANGGAAVFAMAGRHHLAPQEQAGELDAIADPQDGHIQAEDLRRDPGRASSYTDDGPPDRMIPAGFMARMRSMDRSNGWIPNTHSARAPGAR